MEIVKKKQAKKATKIKPVLIRFTDEDYEAHKAEADAEGRELAPFIRHRLKTHPLHKRRK